MAMDNKELKRLQKLACISLSDKEETKLGGQLQNIIGFLDQLKQLTTNSEKLIVKNIDNPLRTLNGTKEFKDPQKLLQNIKHEKLNNCIVIKSVLS